MADSTERLVFDIFARDRDASRTFKRVGDSADKAGDDIKGMGKSATNLDRDIDKTRDHLRGLIAEFERTGDVELFKHIRKNRSALGLLESMRKEISDTTGEAEAGGQKIGKALSGGIGDALGSLPSQLKGAAIVGAVALAPFLAPSIGAAVGGAVLGGAGVGGIIGGVVAASQDSRVKEAAAHFGQSFMADFASAGQPFIGPLVRSLGELETTGASFTSTLRDGFARLAPVIGPVTKGIDGLVHGIDRGLESLFSGPAQQGLRAIGNELPEIGDAIGDAFESISDGSDGATMGLIAMLHAGEDLIRGTGEVVGFLSDVFEWLVRTGTKVTDFARSITDAFSFTEKIPIIGAGIKQTSGFIESMNDETHSLIDGLDKAKDTTGDWSTKLQRLTGDTDAARKAQQDFTQSINDQFDPIANLMHRLDDVKRAQQDYNQAVKDHGVKSQEAKDANLRMAEAILAANGAAATASGTFDGHFTEALKRTLRAGGMTEKQINDIEQAARDARAALNNYADVYKAKAILEFYEYRAGERNPSGKASGGPVMAGQSYIVGENGPELVTMSGNGYVHTAPETRSMMSGASGGSSAGAWAGGVARVVIDVTGGDEDFKRLIRKMVRVEGGGDVQVAFGG